MEVPVARVLKDFCGLLLDSLAGRTSSRKKHLENFFLSVLATGPDDLITTSPSHKTCVFCVLRTIFKIFFEFSLELL